MCGKLKQRVGGIPSPPPPKQAVPFTQLWPGYHAMSLHLLWQPPLSEWKCLLDPHLVRCGDAEKGKEGGNTTLISSTALQRGIIKNTADRQVRHHQSTAWLQQRMQLEALLLYAHLLSRTSPGSCGCDDLHALVRPFQITQIQNAADLPYMLECCSCCRTPRSRTLQTGSS